MKKDEFIYSLKKKSIKSLLDLLKQGQSGQLKIEPEFLQEVITEINNRKLSDSETHEFEKLLNFSFDDSSDTDSNDFVLNNEVRESSIPFITDDPSKLNLISGSNDKEREPGKYTALKTLVGMLSILGYVVIFVGIVLLVFLSFNGQNLFGLIALVVSVVIALPLLAFTNLIHVIIDIEYNTRKTKEALKKNIK
jgi:predicted RND superfamily exporter protein